eukprot:4204938-Prorocentrum_lima.AAC.1
MTSSLVGSEMCIRDRLLLSHGAVTGVLSLYVHRALHHLFRRVASASTSVSYTHLTLPTICSV